MIWLIAIGILIVLGIALYPVPGMIIHDKIYFAVIDGEGEKAIRLFDRYKWLLSKSDRYDLNKRILKLGGLTQYVMKENDGN